MCVVVFCSARSWPLVVVISCVVSGVLNRPSTWLMRELDTGLAGVTSWCACRAAGRRWTCWGEVGGGRREGEKEEA